MQTRFINPIVLTGLFLFFLPTTLLSQPEIEVESIEIDFGSVEIDETASEIMTVTNTGDEQLVIEEIVIDSDFFSDEDFDDFGRHQTYQFEYTDFTHIIIIREATWDGEWLSLDDEVGVFTPDGLCAGAVMVEEVGEMIGIIAYGDDGEGGELNGFRAGEEFEFRYWDCYTDCEVIADIEFIEGSEVWLRNQFTFIELTAEGGCHRIPDGEVIIHPDESAEITIYFHPEEPRA